MMITVTFSRGGVELGRLLVQNGGPPQKHGNLDWLDLNFAPHSQKLGRTVSLRDDAEEWARSLPAAYAGTGLDVSIAEFPSAAAAPPMPQGMTGTMPPVASAAPPLAGAPAFAAPGYPQHAAAYAYPTAAMAAAAAAHQLQLSGWWRRFFAQLLDNLIGIALALFLFGAVVVIRGGSSPSPWIYLLLGLLSQAVYLGGAMARKGIYNGQTLGKQALGIRVVRDDGRPITSGFALVRELLLKQVLDPLFLYLPYCLDYLWPLADGTRRALHDKMLSTHVVSSFVSGEQHAQVYAPYQTGAAAQPPSQAGVIAAIIIFAALIFLMLLIAVALPAFLGQAHHAATTICQQQPNAYGCYGGVYQ